MEFQVEKVGGKSYIKVEGNLDDEPSGRALGQAFDELLHSGSKTIVIDLSGVNIINSFGLGKIMLCRKRCKDEGGVLMLKPAQGFVKEAFELLNLAKRFPQDL